MSTHDLRRKAQRLNDLRRKHKAHEHLSEEEKEELNRGIPASEMRLIILDIRQERVSASPSKKTKAKDAKIEKAKNEAEPIDIMSFLDEEHES